MVDTTIIGELYQYAYESLLDYASNDAPYVGVVQNIDISWAI